MAEMKDTDVTSEAYIPKSIMENKSIVATQNVAPAGLTSIEKQRGTACYLIKLFMVLTLL